LSGLALGSEKAYGCKRWIAIGLALLRFPWAAGLDPVGPAR
jgi:hypothetical protein